MLEILLLVPRFRQFQVYVDGVPVPGITSNNLGKLQNFAQNVPVDVPVQIWDNATKVFLPLQSNSALN
jgi:hypothetical protein